MKIDTEYRITNEEKEYIELNCIENGKTHHFGLLYGNSLFGKTTEVKYCRNCGSVEVTTNGEASFLTNSLFINIAVKNMKNESSGQS